MRQVRVLACDCISVRLHECIHACVDEFGKRQQQQGSDAACCDCICVLRPTIDKANVACYHTHRSQEG